jgi:type I restriction enzyme S subunit
MTEWREVTIEELAVKIAMGPFGSNIKVETFKPYGIPIISGTHLCETRMRDKDFNFISEEHADRLSNSNVFQGDVIFTHAGNIGQVSFIPHNSKYKRYIISQRQFYLRCNSDVLDYEFITYYFKSPYGQYQLLANANQTGVPSLAQPVSYLKSIRISLPPIFEQKAIAEVLSSLDDKIDLLTRQNKTLEDLVQTYFWQWFVEDASEDWEVRKLGDLCEVITKGTTPTTLKKSFVEVGINFLKVESISENGTFIKEKFMHINEETHNLLRRSQLKENDILCSIAGTIGRIARVCKEILPANVNQALAIIRVKKYNSFIYYYLKSDIFQNEIQMRIVESVQANLSLGEISSIELPIPEDLIKKFECFVAPLDKKIHENANQIRTLSKLRDTLLPKLISGEVRVNNKEARKCLNCVNLQ